MNSDQDVIRLLSEQLWANIDPDRPETMLRARDVEHCRTDLAAFAQAIRPEWKLNWHHRLICEAFEQVVWGVATAELRWIEQQQGANSKQARDYRAKHPHVAKNPVPLHNLVITLPPGSAKSEYGGTLGPAWALGNFPHWPIILAGYNAELAKEGGEKTRDVIQGEPAYRTIQPDVEVDRTHSAAGNWKLKGSRERTSMLSVGVGGSATGYRARLFVVDDPIKNPEDARSETAMQSLWLWFNRVARTRLYPSAGATIVIMTRWCEDDIVGRILDQKLSGWKILHLPALATMEERWELKDGAVVTRQPGEPLWPDGGMTTEYFEGFREADPSGFQALYQGDPIPEGGTALDPAWLLPCTEAEWEEAHGLSENEEESQPWPVVYGVDLSTGLGKDFTAIAKLRWNAARGRVIVSDIVRGKWGLADLMAVLQEHAARDNPVKIVVESNAFQAMIAQHLISTTGLPVIKSHTSIGKQATHNATVGTGRHFMTGAALMPPSQKLETPGVAQFRIEWGKFPNGRNDDTLDAVAKGLEGTVLVRRGGPRAKLTLAFAGKQRRGPTDVFGRPRVG